MKKLVAAVLSCLMIVVIMTACSSHSHTETNWTANPAEHWKLCAECGEKTQTGEHTLNDEDICTVCNSNIVDFGDIISVYTNDEHENMLRLADYDADGNLVSEIVYEYEYDADGNILKGKEYTNGALTGETEYTVIDGASVTATYTGYNEDGSKSFNQYDENGNVIKLISYNAEGNVYLESDYEFAQTADGEWYESKTVETHADGVKYEVTNNEQGDALSRVEYDADGNAVSTETWEYTYDAEGRTTSKKEYIDGKLIEELLYKIVENEEEMYNYPETVITYNEDGGKTVSVYDENNTLVSETTYDANGNVIE